MNALRTASLELLGLFVDDGALALLTLLLVAAVTALALFGWLPPLAIGALLFFGAVAILAESVNRATRKS